MYDLFTGFNEISNEKGSNAWVIHGNYTKSGKPLLAGDPHLDNTIPSTWYVSELIYGKNYENYVFFTSIEGSLLMGMGKTNNFSWTSTIRLTDSMSDLFIETLDFEGKKYLFKGKYYDLEIFEEKIFIKGEVDPEIVYSKFNRKGPIIDEVFLPGYEKVELNYNLSLSWGGFQKKTEIFSTYKYIFKDNNNENIIKGFLKPSEFYLNILLITTKGDIMYIPVGNNYERIHQGFYKNGSLRSEEWKKIIPRNKLPILINPKKGYIISANSKYVSDNSDYSPCYNCIITARSVRLTQLIEKIIKSGKKIGIEEMKAIQMDELDVFAEIIVKKAAKIIQNVMRSVETHAKIDVNFYLEKLKLWDHVANKESPQAALWYTFEFKLLKKLFESFPETPFKRFIIGSYPIEQFLLNYINNTFHFFNKKHKLSWVDSFCRNDSVPKNYLDNSCIYSFYKSFVNSIEILTKECGEDFSQWRYDCVHQMEYDHILFGKIPFLNKFFNKKFKTGGWRRTVKVAVPNFAKDTLNGFHSPNFRSYSEKEKSFWILDMGNSANFLDVFYDNLHEKYKKDEYIEIKHWKQQRYLYESYLK